MNNFLKDWKENKIYFKRLRNMGKISGLWTDFSTAYLDYKFTEKCFCECYDFTNIAAQSASFDAIKDGIGIGIKTFQFLGNTTLEVVGEFSKMGPELRKLKGMDLIIAVTKIKNERLISDMKKFGVNEIYYHLIARNKKGFIIFNTDYSLIDISNITITENTEKRIVFNDGKNEYVFSLAKGKLQQRFEIPKDVVEMTIVTEKNPWILLDKIGCDNFIDKIKSFFGNIFNKKLSFNFR